MKTKLCRPMSESKGDGNTGHAINGFKSILVVFKATWEDDGRTWYNIHVLQMMGGTQGGMFMLACSTLP